MNGEMPLAARVRSHEQELVTLRRQLHMHPELSGEEHATTELVAQRLRVAGLQPVVMPSGVGLTCDVGPGPATVALRADLDALAMEDEKEVEYRSQVAGVAHACGHDAHTVIVLGAGLVLDELLRDAGAGGVRLLFQSAEETVPGGALDLIAAGALEGIETILGVHCDPKLDVGDVGLRAGPITSAADLVRVELHGPGGHTARPHLTVDLVRLLATVARDLPDRLREHEPALSLVWGSVGAGDAPNVIPASGHLHGTLRTPDRDAWQRAPEVVRKLAAAVVDGTGVHVEVDHRRGPPPVVNHEAAVALLAGAATAELGTDRVQPTVQSAGGDDFAWYLEHVDGAYARLGVHDPASPEPRLDLHASTFDIDERAIAVGVTLLARAACDALSGRT